MESAYSNRTRASVCKKKNKKLVLSRHLLENNRRAAISLNLSCSCLVAQLFTGVRLSATSWAAEPQAPLALGFSRQEYWSGLPVPSPGDLPDPGIKPGSPALQENSLPAELPGKPMKTGVGSLSLLQGIFPTQRSNGGLLHCGWILYQPRKERKHYLKKKGIHYFKCASRGTTQAS